MTSTARHTLAVVGAGPIGLEAAIAGLDRGFDVHVFEQGEVGSHPIAWGHVRMFTPWRMNLGPHSAARLRASGWETPDLEACPTGREYAERYLTPLARLPELKERLHTHSQVVHMSRRGLLKGDAVGRPERREHPFRLLVRDAGGRENFLHAYSLIDASGVYAQPNWAGDGGIPARGELYLAPQLSYHLDDVLGLARARYAGKRTAVIGGGPSGATLVRDLARLAEEVPETRAVWVTREVTDAVCPDVPGDPLAERRALFAAARELTRGSNPAIAHVGGARLEGLEFNSATHRYRLNLVVGEQPRLEEVDQVIVNTGYGPDNALYRELQVHECYASRGPMKLATTLLEAADCLAVPATGVEALANPEPDFYIVGNKSYGRSSHFLLETGFKQVAGVIEKLAGEIATTATA